MTTIKGTFLDYTVNGGELAMTPTITPPSYMQDHESQRLLKSKHQDAEAAGKAATIHDRAMLRLHRIENSQSVSMFLIPRVDAQGNVKLVKQPHLPPGPRGETGPVDYMKAQQVTLQPDDVYVTGKHDTKSFANVIPWALDFNIGPSWVFGLPPVTIKPFIDLANKTVTVTELSGKEKLSVSEMETLARTSCEIAGKFGYPMSSNSTARFKPTDFQKAPTLNDFVPKDPDARRISLRTIDSQDSASYRLVIDRDDPKQDFTMTVERVTYNGQTPKVEKLAKGPVTAANFFKMMELTKPPREDQMHESLKRLMMVRDMVDVLLDGKSGMDKVLDVMPRKETSALKPNVQILTQVPAGAVMAQAMAARG